jgi:hypothetical protein
MDLWQMLGITRQTGLLVVGAALLVTVVLGFVFRVRAARGSVRRGLDLGNHG